jgi:hypothetical protein
VADEMAGHGLEDLLLHFRQRRGFRHGCTWRQMRNDECVSSRLHARAIAAETLSRPPVALSKVTQPPRRFLLLSWTLWCATGFPSLSMMAVSALDSACQQESVWLSSVPMMASLPPAIQTGFRWRSSAYRSCLSGRACRRTLQRLRP